MALKGRNKRLTGKSVKWDYGGWECENKLLKSFTVYISCRGGDLGDFLEFSFVFVAEHPNIYGRRTRRYE